MASQAAGTGVAVLRETTAEASAVYLAEKANAHKAGMNSAQHITLQKRGAELAAELKEMSGRKPTFAETEQMIQKIDAYKREVDNNGNTTYLESIYHQQTTKPIRMETRKFGVVEYKVKSQIQDEPVNHLKNVLGPYGYEPITDTKNPGDPSGRVSHYEVLDTALHNWRVSSQEQGKGSTDFPARQLRFQRNGRRPWIHRCGKKAARLITNKLHCSLNRAGTTWRHQWQENVKIKPTRISLLRKVNVKL
jgi:hypothetical protein